MKLTKEHYEAAKIIFEDFNKTESWTFRNYLKTKIEELSQPPYSTYKCIKNSSPFGNFNVGHEFKGEIIGDMKLKDFPCHWLEIPPVRPAITWAETYRGLERYFTGTAHIRLLEDILKRIALDHIQ